ncbi:MAG: hypothetical protein ABW328_21990 [Ilumatobacteraceae bacterium]
MELKPGARLRSAADETEIIVVKAPGGDVDLRCGGHPVVAHGDARPDGLSPDADHAGGTQIGKRYTDPAATLEVLCTKAGGGALSIGSEPLVLKDAKPLPSSD